MIENLGVLPTIEAVAELYRSCHIGLVFMFTKHPSYQPIEMMASGVCVITNNNSATKWFLINGKNSLVVEPTITSVAQAVSLLVVDRAYRNGLAAEGLSTAGQTSWETEIERVYRFLTGRGSMVATDMRRAPLLKAQV